VRELRAAAAKTIAEAADEAGMTEAEWLSVEEGRRTPTLAALLGMAKALGCGAGDLLARPGARVISPPAGQAAALFEQCPAEVQESILNLLRKFLKGPGGKRR
jgi:transcriptional regulator with XRE-family HTH domain